MKSVRPLPQLVLRVAEELDIAVAPEVTALRSGGVHGPRDVGLLLCKDEDELAQAGGNAIILPAELEYLQPGDVIAISSDLLKVRVLWRTSSRHNTFLLTERCDNYCLMCSQPPRDRDDSWLLDEVIQAIQLIPSDAEDIGITGGEPTLYGDDFVHLLHLLRDQLPAAEVHVLSNGRRFADPRFTAAVAAVGHPGLMIGIPIYGSEPSLHDFVVQADGAFNETVTGVLRLGEAGVRTELRVVLHKQTAPYIVEIAEFIARNLPFVEQVALMGLEMMGLARGNISHVWIDPYEYRAQLAEAVARLDSRGIPTMIYNHQLCLLEESARPFAVASISDWKNDYVPECEACDARASCGGFFVSSRYRRSSHIRAIKFDSEPSTIGWVAEPGAVPVKLKEKPGRAS